MAPLDRSAFVEARELHERSESATRSWQVCSEYELRKPADKVRPDYATFRVVPKYSRNQKDKWRKYYPLEDTPDLFLKLARLHRGGRDLHVDSVFVGSVLDWVHKYGLLVPEKRPYAVGSGEVINDFAESAYRAAGILAMYEAALNGDEVAAKRAILEEFLSVDPLGSELKRVSKQRFAAFKAGWIEQRRNGSYVEYALETAMQLVTLTVRDECFPILYPSESASDPSQISAGWGFKSLEGALYLQMYWLMASGGDVTRCEYCGRMIALSRPHPKNRKPRRDKRFCNDACRQAHHRSKKRS